MSDNVENAVFEILKKIQGDLAAFRGSVDQRFEAVDRRFEAMDRRFDAIDGRFDSVDLRLGSIETVVRRHQRDNAGMLVMTRAVSGDFDKRVTELEQRVKKLEAEQH